MLVESVCGRFLARICIQNLAVPGLVAQVMGLKPHVLEAPQSAAE